MDYLEFVIRRWFNDNRPDISDSVSGRTIENILKELEDELSNVPESLQKAVIHGYLRLNYSPEIGDMIKEALEEMEEPYKTEVETWKDLGMYIYEVGGLMSTASLRKIPEEYLIIENDEIGYAPEIREKIKELIIERIEEDCF